jgi:membrane protease YdiL (CAAX protease family)
MARASGDLSIAFLRCGVQAAGFVRLSGVRLCASNLPGNKRGREARMSDAMEVTGAGTRPLWRRIVDFPLVSLLVAIGLLAAAVAAGAMLGKLVPPIGRVPVAAAHAAINIAIVFAVYKLAIRHLGERPRDDLGEHGALWNLWLGLLAGFLLFSAVVGVAALSGVYRIVGAGSTEDLLFDLITIAILPGFMEELAFRGILFRWIEELAGSWAALVITAALFGFSHILNPNATWFSSFALAMEAGLLLGGAYMLTRSLWMPIGLHAAWNYTQGFVFDVPVSGMDQQGLVQAKLSGPELLSGGSFGLEASLIALVLATAAGVALILLAVRRGELVQPWWVRRRGALEAA